MAEALLSPDQHKQIANSILAIASNDINKYEQRDIDFCLDILKKIRSKSNNDRRMATAKISSKLQKVNFKHNEADLNAIANLLLN